MDTPAAAAASAAALAPLTVASAETVLTSVARDGPPLTTLRRLYKAILVVLSSPRSGSSLLQLCLQANKALYAGQELHLLQFASLDERRALCPFELLEGLVKTVAELRRCDIGDAAEWVADAEEEATLAERLWCRTLAAAAAAIAEASDGPAPLLDDGPGALLEDGPAPLLDDGPGALLEDGPAAVLDSAPRVLLEDGPGSNGASSS